MSESDLPAIVRIAILEDDQDLRGYLATIIQQNPRFQLAFSVETLAAARAAARETDFDICLVDIHLPDGSGIDFLSECTADKGQKSLILTALGDRCTVMAALKGGADGYLLKDTPPEFLGNAILQTMAGGNPISPQVATFLLETWQSKSQGADQSAYVNSMLTEREVEVLEILARGLSYKECAQVLEISHYTVSDHVKSIHRKLSVHSRAEAIFEARQLGLIASHY